MQITSKPEKIHDRRAADLPINSAVSIAIVPDPYSHIGEKIEVLRSIRDDPLAGLKARDRIDDAQYAAGRKWQALHEASTIGVIRAIDPAKEAVDGGRMAEFITDHQMKAFRQLRESYQELGVFGGKLIFSILAERKQISEIARAWGYTSELEIKYIGQRFRECLETLATLWGFAQIS